MFIDYQTKKFGHLNTLNRFILYYKLCFGVYDTSTSMKMNVPEVAVIDRFDCTWSS